MVKCFDKFRISHIPREENKKANTLRKLAVVQCEGLMKGLLVEELNERVRRRGIRRNQADQDIYKGLKPIYQAYSSKIMYEHYFKSFIADTKSRLRKSSAPLVGFSGEIYHPLGLIDLRVTMECRRREWEDDKKKSVLLDALPTMST
ncbi:hypothetical protein Tco_0834295 [Tanacetum coccineum]